MDDFEKFCDAVNLHLLREVYSFCLKNSSGKKNQERLDGIILNYGPNGQSVATDASVANPMSLGKGVHPAPLEAATRRETAKFRKYKKELEELNMGFLPFVFDAYGGIPTQTVERMIKPIASRIKNYTPVNYAAPTALIYWIQRFSVTLWKGNAYKLRFLSPIRGSHTFFSPVPAVLKGLQAAEVPGALEM